MNRRSDKLKKNFKKSAGLLIIGFVFLLAITLVGIKDLSSTFALQDGTSNIVDGFKELSIPEGTKASPGDKIYVNLDADREKWEYISIRMRSTTSSEDFVIYLKDIKTSKPYFILPDGKDNSSSSKLGVKVGEKYELKDVNLFSKCNYDNKENCDNSAISISTYKLDNKPFMNIGEKKYVEVVEKNNSTSPNLKINNFILKDSTIYLNEKAYVKFDYTGEADKAYIYATNKTDNKYLTIPVNDFNSDNPYVNGNDFAVPGTYVITGVSICDSEHTTEETKFGSPNFGELVILENKKNEEDVDKKNEFKLVEINLNTYEAKAGDKIDVDINANKDIKSALIIFYDKDNNQSISAYVKNFKGHPYFILPSIANVGNYRLQKIIIKDEEGNTQVTNVPEFEGKSYTDENGVFYETIELKVTADKIEDKKSITFNNEDYDDLMAKKIDELEDDAVITVVCDNYPLVKGILFGQIAETRKTLILQYGDFEWVFNGTDIVDTKYVDVSMLLSSIKNSDFSKSNISSKISDSDTTILNFSNNGELPGKALIRLNSTELDSKFGNKDIFVYYYNAKNDSLMKVALEVQKIEGYYEFYINHNSIYVLSSKELKGNYISEDKKYLTLNTTNTEITTNEENNNNNILYYVIGASTVIIIILLAIIFKNKKK